MTQVSVHTRIPDLPDGHGLCLCRSSRGPTAGLSLIPVLTLHMLSLAFSLGVFGLGSRARAFCRAEGVA